MAKVYHQGKYGIKTIEEAGVNKKYTNAILELKELPSLYLETENDKLKGKICLFKCIEPWNKVQKIIDSILKLGFKQIAVKQGSSADFQMDKFTLRIYKSGGRLQNVIDEEGNAKSSKQPSTAQQEDGVVYSLNYGSFDPDYLRKEIGFNFDKSWNESFEKTFSIISKNIDIKQYNIYRDSAKGKPKFLDEMTNEKILPDKKDNWNPSDLWMVKKSYKGDDILDITSRIKKKETNITELNEVLKENFENGNLIGISLKKVTNTANFKKVEVDTENLSKLKFSKIKSKNEMSVLNSYFDVNILMKQGTEFEYLIRLRPRGKSGSLKVYFEGKPPSRGAWDGAVSKKLLESKYFKQKLNDFEKIVIQNNNYKGNLNDYIVSLQDQDFIKFMSKPNNLVSFKDLNKNTNNTYELQRGAVLCYCIYLMSNYSPQKAFYKDSVLSAMKLNEFSSVYYKVY
jgi:hypothetical protein